MNVSETALAVARENFAEAKALEAEAEAMPRWRWYARWRRRDKARIIRLATGQFLLWEEFRKEIQDGIAVLRSIR